jgi:hypothetical protein
VAGGPPRLTLVPGGGSERPAPGPMRAPDVAAARELVALGTGLVLAFVLMARLGSWAREVAAFQVLYAIAFGFFALALTRAFRRTVPHAAWIVFAVAVAARLAVLPVHPSLSDDVYRYVWEGTVAAHGGNPYRASPGDPSWAALRDRTIHPRINHPELATVYPPLAIAGFALVAALSPTVTAMKVWVVLHDLALVALLILWAARRGGGAQAAIAYAWNPLPVVEHAGSAHHDPTAIVWLIAALVMVERRPVLSALALAAGVLVKLAPLVALPFLLVRWPWRARLAALIPIAAGLGWFWHETRGADSGLGAYARTWSNNELAFAALAAVVRDPIVARAIVAVAVAGLLIVLLVRRREAAAATRTALRAGFLLSPVAHPWYLAWVLALEPLEPSAPWLLLSLTAMLSYGVLATPPEGGRFHLPLLWRCVEYGVPLLVAIAFAARSRKARRGAPVRQDVG